MNIYMNTSEFQHDIRMLLMAFFPGAELKVIVNDRYFLNHRPSPYLLHEQELHYSQEAVSNAALQNWVAVCLDEELWFGYYDKENCLTQGSEAFTEIKRKARKDHVKRLIYRQLSSFFKITLPWGTLTGIRPVKMVCRALERQQTKQRIEQELRENYLMSSEKIELSMKVAQTERQALSNISYQNEYSLYVGIPFCPSRCAYCSFTSYPLSVWKDKTDAYVEKLCEEIRFTIELFGRERITTIYVGGGTPTALSEGQLDSLLFALRRESEHSNVRELTVEAGRPDSITKEKLKTLKRYGVDRISINPQTMNQKTLDRIGRRHTVMQTKEAFELARELGFDNINMDMIVGLPGEEEQDVEYTLKQLKTFSPDSLTVHSLALKRAADLNIKKEEYADYQSKNSGRLMRLTENYAQAMGMFPYYLYRQKNMSGNFENVGYSKKDKIALYNILIMEELQTIAAVGAGGSTKLYIPIEERIERVENVKDVAVYMQRFDEMLERKKQAVLREKGRLFHA